jgi:flagellar basal body rod protein FlgG
VEITSNGGNSSAYITVDEGNAAVTTITATQDGFTDLPGNTLTFAIFGGVDEALFEIDADSGALSFRTGPSFEVPEDADGDNAYLVDVTVSDANGSTDTQALSIAIANIEGAADLDDSGNILFTQRVIANFMGRRAHQIT